MSDQDHQSEEPAETAGESGKRPTVLTRRLLLRPFRSADADAVRNICQEREIAANTRTVPHPYPEGAAKEWIEQHPKMWLDGTAAVFAICISDESEWGGQLIGAIGLEINENDQHAEIGYWMDKTIWGQGYCTEAAAAVLDYGFDELGLHKIFAHFMTRNPASGRVMQKIGMVSEGLMRGHVRKWGVFEDVEFYGILKSDPRPFEYR